MFRKIIGKLRKEKKSNNQENIVFPADCLDSEQKIIRKVKPYTMTSIERLIALSRAIDYLENYQLEGDIVECGVWRGGSMMLVAEKLVEHNNISRNLFLFDTYMGMSEPGDTDISFDNIPAADQLEANNKYQGDNVWCYSTLEEVKTNMAATHYSTNQVHYIQGKVEETLPYPGINKIALLRLDTDWYESTKAEMIHLFDKLVPGGILIIDDYGHWQGAKKAVDEYFRDNNIQIFLSRIDYTGRIAVKS